MTTPMRAPMTIAEIERRLRLAAPDEPSMLPALVLPTGAAALRGPVVRVRAAHAVSRDSRLVFALVTLLLALAVAAVGAIRLLDRDTPLDTSCNPMIAGLDTCLPIAVPAGWVDLGAGQFAVGEFSEPGLGYVHVQQVFASTPLGACPTPGGPFPQAVPSGDGEEVVVPLPTPDAGLACLRAAPLPDNGVRIVTLRGSRILGGDETTGGIPDTSEPTRDAGWTETVDGRPARLQILNGAAGGPAETRIWDVLWPGSLEAVLRIRADIAGPDLGAGRAKAQSVVDAVDFRWDVPPLREEAATDVLRRVLDQLERDGRESQHSDLYGCFPRERGQAVGTVRGSDAGPLPAPLAVTCASDIDASLAGVWRITLEVSWEAGDGYDGDTLRFLYFSSGVSFGDAGTMDMTGAYTTSLAGRTANWDDPAFSWIPNAEYALPEVLKGPLDLPAGSLAKVLWPGESTASAPGAGDDSLYPGSVGTHVWVMEGPVVVEGDEWYRVQAGSAFALEAGWIRGTRDGRPQLRAIEPECPAADGLTVGDITWLIAAERLLCFGDREITIEQGEMTFQNAFSDPICAGEDGTERPCATSTGDAAWIATQPGWQLYGTGGPQGPHPGMYVWLAPGVTAPVDGASVRVRGHFDDPAAQACRDFPTDGFPVGENADHHDLLLLVCRERFVITSIEER